MLTVLPHLLGATGDSGRTTEILSSGYPVQPFLFLCIWAVLGSFLESETYVLSPLEMPPQSI